MRKFEESESRRSALKILTASGVVAGSAVHGNAWVKPVVQSVLLPAHAQTSARDDPSGSIDDPCFLSLECGDDTIVGTVTGQVVGDGDLSGIQIDIVYRLDGGNVRNDEATTGSDGSWGPETVTYNATSGEVTATISSPDIEFDPFTCRASIDCSEEEPPRECSEEWDKSSLSEDGIDCDNRTASFCNGADSEAFLCPVDYEVLHDPSLSGKPNFQLVFSGQITDVPIEPGDCRTIDFSDVVEDKGNGRYRVVVFQHPAHPGNSSFPIGECTIEDADD